MEAHQPSEIFHYNNQNLKLKNSSSLESLIFIEFREAAGEGENYHILLDSTDPNFHCIRRTSSEDL